jgi:mannose-1-phosphate guanylyltransferase
VLERSILDMVPADQNVSIEREVWPRLVGQGLYGYPTDAYWLDIGTPERYLQGTFDIIEGKVDTAVGQAMGDSFLSVSSSADVAGRAVPPAVVEDRVSVGRGAQVGPLVVLGGGVRVGEGSIVERAVVLQGAEIGANCVLRDCIVAAGARVGDRSEITAGAVLGEGVTIGADNVVTSGARVFPGVEIPDGGLKF